MGLVSIHELCRRIGVTRRTLQHYDNLGLLPPTGRTEGGVRQYDERAEKTLLEILTYKEFGFSLEEIKRLLQDPSFDKKAALEGRIAALTRERDHLNALIGFAEAVNFYGIVPIQLQEAGDIPYSEFLAKLRAGWNMDVLSEAFMPLVDERPEWNNLLTKLYDDLCGMCGEEPESAPVQEKVGELHRFIQENICQSPTLSIRLLGITLLSGGEYSRAMKQAYGDDAVRFAAEAIRIYCDRMERQRTEPQKPGMEWKLLFEAAAQMDKEDN